MKGLSRTLLVIAWFQALSTLTGCIQLLTSHWYDRFLVGSPFEGRNALAALLLGGVTGGFQWAAIWVHHRHPRQRPAAHTLAGLVMCGWIAGECLVLNTFQWPHALWGGLGVMQILLVSAWLGAFRGHQPRPGAPAASLAP